METKREILNFYPYEYETLENHFRCMAQKGWMLERIIGNSQWVVITYKKVPPQDLYFVTDFTAENKMLSNNMSQKTKDYINFIEDYGLEFVTSFQELLVYKSVEPITIKLREDTKDTRKQLRTATFKHIFFESMLAIVWVLNFSMRLRFDSDSLASNTALSTLFITFLISLIFLVMIAPAIWWMIHPHHKTAVWKMKLHAVTTMLFFVLLVASFLLSFGTQLAFIAFLLGALGIVAFYLYQVIATKSRNVKIASLVLLVMAGIGCLLLSSKVVVHNEIRMHTGEGYIVGFEFTGGETYMDPKLDIALLGFASNGKEKVYLTQSLLLRKEVYYYDDASNTESFTMMYVKNTPFQDFVKDKIINEYDHMKQGTKERGKSYSMYSRNQDMLIQKGDVLLSLDKAHYEALSVKQLDTFFKEAEEYWKDEM